MHSDDYRRLQEERFSNNDGASFLEIFLLSQLPFVLSLFSTTVTSKIRGSYSINNLSLEFASIYIPQILLLTTLSEYLNLFYILLCFVSCTALLCLYSTMNVKNARWILKHVTVEDSKLPCITSFRSIVNSFSIICILAADFKCFPERYLKTEIYGYGLMDTGVGLYVISNAFTNSHFTKQTTKEKVKIFPFILSTLKKVMPLLIIGVGRYIATAAVQYHQNVSEYGVHWNFFISLSVLAILNELLILFVNRINTVYVLIVISLSLHEFMLYAGVKSWVNDDPSRVGFLASNKEGICSLLGYEVIYLCGIVIKHYLPRKGDKFEKYFSSMYKFLIAFIVCTIFTMLSEYTFGVSRKFANCGYIFWIISLSLISLIHGVSQEFILYIFNVTSLKNEKHVSVIPLIMEAINYNGLVFFLAGNLLTGVINICVPTLTVNSTNGVLILIFYMSLCCYSVICLYKKNIRLR
ncbi:phosphatidylinositol-glycan biosynthesis class W protein-like [Planococcus citri]|uniref:phosphatidylinositol-glycan biosynthesis class W protein-like n=1 Tax=Planococcus citri TaxID=170843 RepID=UPI0031F9A7EE